MGWGGGLRGGWYRLVADYTGVLVDKRLGSRLIRGSQWFPVKSWSIRAVSTTYRWRSASPQVLYSMRRRVIKPCSLISEAPSSTWSVIPLRKPLVS